MGAEMTFGIRPNGKLLVATLHRACECCSRPNGQGYISGKKSAGLGRVLTLRTRVNIHVSRESARSWKPFFTGLALMHLGFSR